MLLTSCSKQNAPDSTCLSLRASSQASAPALSHYGYTTMISWSLHVCPCRLVREYLDLEFVNHSLPFPFSVERVIDDFVMMCMLSGNDFLPRATSISPRLSVIGSTLPGCMLASKLLLVLVHQQVQCDVTPCHVLNPMLDQHEHAHSRSCLWHLFTALIAQSTHSHPCCMQCCPSCTEQRAVHIMRVICRAILSPILAASLNAQCHLCAALPTLDIGEGALDKMFAIYKAILPSLGGYLTDAGTLHKGRLQVLLHRLGQLEQDVLEERAQVGPACPALPVSC